MRRFVLAVTFLVCAVGMSGQVRPDWALGTPLPEALSGHGAVMVHTGDVLVVGGLRADGSTSDRSYVIDGRTGAVRLTANTMATSRCLAAVVELRRPDGSSEVYAIGGYTGGGGSYSSTATIERCTYIPAIDQWRWSAVGSLPVALAEPRAVFNGGDHIIVCGGRVQTAAALGTGTVSATAARIHRQTGAVDRLSDMSVARVGHALMRQINAVGALEVIVAGGEASGVPTTELLAGTSWDGRANPPRELRSYAVAMGDPAGIARMSGGRNATTTLSTAEWYDVKSGWRGMPRPLVARSHAASTLIAGPRDTAMAYLVAGGRASDPVSDVEVFTLPTSSDPAGFWEAIAATPLRVDATGLAITDNNLPVVVAGRERTAPTKATMWLRPARWTAPAYDPTEVGARSDSVLIVLENTWLLPVTVTIRQEQGSAEFLVTADTAALVLPAGSKRIIKSWFRPSVSGQRTSAIVIDYGPIQDTIPLRGTGLSSTVRVLAASIDAGDVAVGTSDTVCAHVLVNDGSDTLRLDSLVMTPPDRFTVLSPKGVVRVAPGDTLRACIVFAPQVRGAEGATLECHYGARHIPVATVGKGIRTYAVATGSTTCDTVMATRGTDVPTFVTIRNPGDGPIVVNAVNVIAARQDLFSVGTSQPIPFTLAPGATVVVDIILHVQREAREQAVVRFVSNSDTAVEAPVCIVIRSRTIQASRDSIEIGPLCAGDSVDISVDLTNAGAFDVIRIDSVIVTGDPAITLDPVNGVELRPRSSLPIVCTLRPSVSGDVRGTISARGPFGSIDIPVHALVRPSIGAAIADRSTSVGLIDTVSITFADPAMREARFRIELPYRALDARRVVGRSADDGIDEAASSLVHEGNGTYSLRATWTKDASVERSLGIEVEVLRSDVSAATVHALSDPLIDVCLDVNEATVFIAGACGPDAGVVAGRQTLVARYAGAGRDEIDIVVDDVLNAPAQVELYDVRGILLHTLPLPSSPAGAAASMPAAGIPDGVCVVRLRRTDAGDVVTLLHVLR